MKKCFRFWKKKIKGCLWLRLFEGLKAFLNFIFVLNEKAV